MRFLLMVAALAALLFAAESRSEAAVPRFQVFRTGVGGRVFVPVQANVNRNFFFAPARTVFVPARTFFRAPDVVVTPGGSAAFFTPVGGYGADAAIIEQRGLFGLRQRTFFFVD